MYRTAFTVLIASGLLLAGCAAEEPEASAPATEGTALWQMATVIFEPLPEFAAREDGGPTEAQIDLGARLYFDKQLSKEGNISCDSCHDLNSYGVDNLSFSPGDAGELGGRNSPTVLNAALHVAQFWDGRAADVEEQAGMPILNPVEMAVPHEEFLVDRLAASEEYPALFAEAFPGEEQPLTYPNLQIALAAFERTLMTPSRFDDYLEGDQEAMTPEEIEGMRTFISLGCTACHNGATVGARIYRKFGLNDDYWVLTGSKEVDDGRFVHTGDEADRFVFKVPSLRNVAETGPYFHDGSVAELADAVRVMASLQVGLELEDEQVASLVTFLEALTGQLPEAATERIERFRPEA